MNQNDLRAQALALVSELGEEFLEEALRELQSICRHAERQANQAPPMNCDIPVKVVVFDDPR